MFKTSTTAHDDGTSPSLRWPFSTALSEALDPVVSQLPPCYAGNRVVRAVKALKRNIRKLPRNLAKRG
ncbi:hypothetical protein AB7M47_004955 [Bradyrhizobium elkanii]|jgi:hypothetical protein